MPTVWIPGPLKQLAGGKDTVEAAGKTIKELIEDVDRRYPGFKSAIVKEGLIVKPGISIAVDGKIVKKGLLHPVEPSSEVFFIPAIGGG